VAAYRDARFTTTEERGGPQIQMATDALSVVVPTLSVMPSAEHQRAVCLSPWTDLTLSADSMRSRASADPAVDRATLQRWADYYLAGADAGQPLASPLYADLSGLPPVLLLVGTAEVLLDDTVRIARKAAAAGVEVVCEQWPDLGHVFAAYATTPEAAQAATLIGSFLRKHLA
jgi:epsilon-lactone hydrolase